LAPADSRTSGLEDLTKERALHAIGRVPTGVAAFVGRTLKGPVNRPVAIASFSDFQHIFGGLWQPAPVSYAIDHYFENGGRRAFVVRVANGARPPTITLPAGSSNLRLIGVNPGSREFLRASVDYDGIPESDTDSFNLVVQRVRSAGSELIEDQEIFRRLSVLGQSGRFVTNVLLESHLARVHGPVPIKRPERSATGGSRSAIGYAVSNPDGDDGAPLTDYDVIGSAAAGTGMFALQATSAFNLLCIPPLAREQDVGLSTLLVAAKFCRDRHAILLVDPPSTWISPRTALEALRNWPFRSDSAVMYFPRVQSFDRLRGRAETFASCGAAAGMIARSDETSPVWAATESEESFLRPGLRPAAVVSDKERVRLSQAGVNTLVSSRSNVRQGLSPRTLAAGGVGASDWKYLSARRLALFVASSIEQGTRWVLLEPNIPSTWERARALVDSFLEALAEQGAFVGTSPDESHFAIADDRVNREETVAEGKFNLLYGFATSKPGEFDTWMVTHRPGSSRVRPVSVNRLATSKHRVEWEIETAILRDHPWPSPTYPTSPVALARAAMPPRAPLAQ
jgi:phage tail sheath protein FI